jgi:HEAT repeat protein
MPSVFISYSHDSADPAHAERVAGLAASLLEGGLEVFFDQNRGDEEEKVPWETWMEDKILEADHVLMVCTELYRKKIRQEVAEDEGQGVCWEAGVIFALLYRLKRNTTKFLPVLFSPADKCFIPLLLQGKQWFVVDTQSGYERLYAFLTGQHRARFPKRGASLQTVEQKTIKPLFSPPGKTTTPASRRDLALTLDKAVPAINPKLTLKPDISPAPREDLRGLDWYDECDAGHFLGRNDDVDRILPMLLSHPIIRLVGPSGVGKSSLIRAGLLPKIRKFGWRACVIRPFEDPGWRIPLQLTAQLLTSAGAFTTPFDPAKFRADVAPLLSSNGITRLVLVLDQFEDIVSPIAAPAAVDAMREFLGALWQQKEIEPYLRAVVVYRTDAEARLGRLWQEVSGRPEGLPYLALEGLSCSVAETIINQTAREQGWRLETSVPEIVRQLALESQKLDCSGEVFPVYLQIFLKQAEQSTEGCTTTEFIASLGGVAGLIGKYLEQTLGRLKVRGGDWQQCGAVLESLSRSTGAKAAQSLNDLVRETGVSRAVLAEMLSVLVDERLVRPVGHETYEIQHDRLAVAVIESMKDSDREAKAAREFLAAKVSAFEWTMVSLPPGELVYLYRHRQKIHPAERELRVLLASVLHNIEVRARNESPGAYWFSESLPQDFLRWFIQIEHWAAKERSSLRPSHEWVKTFPIRGLESQFTALAADPVPSVREICGQWIGRTKRDEDLPLLRQLAKDENPAVRAAAVRALASFSRTEDLSLLREMAKGENRVVRVAAVEALASFPRPENLPLLRELAKDQDRDLRDAAVVVLESFSRVKDLPLLREMAKDENPAVRAAAVRALASFLRTEDLPLPGEFAKDEDPAVRDVAVRALASFSRPENLPLLREMAKDENPVVRAAAVSALASFSRTEDLPLLRELAKDENWAVRDVAVTALESFPRPENLPLLREPAKDQYRVVRAAVVGAFANLRGAKEDQAVRAAAVKELASFHGAIDPLLLRELAKDQDRDVRDVAVRALARFPWPENLPLLRELAKDQDRDVRAATVEALASFPRPENLPLLRELAKDQDREVRDVAVTALESFPRPENLPLLRELAKDQDREVRATALTALANLPGTELLPLLRKLAKDQDRDLRAAMQALASFPQLFPLPPELAKDQDRAVRAAAVRALASFSQPEDLPLLRELAKDQDWDVRAAAMGALTSSSRIEDLPLLRELALAPDDNVAAEAVRSLILLCSREELEGFLNQHDQKLCAVALAALDEVLYMPEWLKPQDKELER